MKKFKYWIVIVLVFLLAAFLWFYGYYNRKSNDNLPSKDLIVTYCLEKGEDYAAKKLHGYQNTQLTEVWGEPDGSLFGLWADTWETSTQNNIFVYYDSNGFVKAIKIDSRTNGTAYYEASEENGVLCSYSEAEDGTWNCDDKAYQYRLELKGRMPNASCDSVFVYLSNIPEISFEQAYLAAGFSSNSEDYFSPEDAVLVEMRNE